MHTRRCDNLAGLRLSDSTYPAMRPYRILHILAGLSFGLMSCARAQSDTPRSLAGPLAEVAVPQGMQDFAVDERHGYVYIQDVKKVEGDEEASVSRYRFRRDGGLSFVDRSAASRHIGHQGLSVEAGVGGGVYLWASASEGNGRTAVRFKYRADQPPADVENYTLFDTSFIDKNTTVPEVCRGERYLVARGRKATRVQYIAVFDLNAVATAGPGQPLHPIHQWLIDKVLFADGKPLQGLACSEQEVYILIGDSKPDSAKRLYVYDMVGNLLRRHEELQPGVHTAMAEGVLYEPEGLAVFTPPAGRAPLVIAAMVSGRGKDKRARLWPLDTVQDKSPSAPVKR